MSTSLAPPKGSMLYFEKQIQFVKYLLLFSNLLEWMLGVAIMALCLWLRFEPGIEEWLTKLDATSFYSGIYVLIVAALLMVFLPYFGCLSAMQENKRGLLVYIGTQMASFIFGLAGSAVLLDNSTRGSSFQPLVREQMRRFIMDTHNEDARQTLAMIQENIGCCGADGANDYLSLRQPLPTECRDTVTGNVFFHGCVDELTWSLEQKCAWVAGLVLTAVFFSILSTVLSTILLQALEKEEKYKK